MTESEGKGDGTIRGQSEPFEATGLSGLRIATADIPNGGGGGERGGGGGGESADDTLAPVWQKIAFEVEVHSAADDNDEETQRKTEDNEYDEDEEEEDKEKFDQSLVEDEDGKQRNQYFNFAVIQDGVVIKEDDDLNGSVDAAEKISENKIGFELMGQSERQLTAAFESVDAEEVSRASYESVAMSTASGNDDVKTETKADEASKQPSTDTVGTTSTDTVGTILQTLHHPHHQQQQFQISSSDLSSNVSLIRDIAGGETSYNIPTAFVQCTQQQNPAENQPSILNQAKLLQGSLAPTTFILIDPSKDRRRQLNDCMLIQNGSDANSPIFLLQLSSQPLIQRAIVNPDYSAGGGSVQHFSLGDPGGFLFHHSNPLPPSDSVLQEHSAGGGEQRGVTTAVMAAGDSAPGAGLFRSEEAEAEAALNAGSRKSDRLKTKKPLGWKTSKNLDEISESSLAAPNSRKRRTPNRGLKQPGDQEKLAKYGDDDNDNDDPCVVLGATDALTSHISAAEGRGNHHHHQQQQQQLPLSVAVSTGNGPVSGSATRMFTCSICNKDFTTEKYLSMHISLHNNNNNNNNVVGPLPGSLTATTASSSSASLDELPIRRSKATVPGSTAQWTCKICEKTFAQNSNYKNHIRTHSNERPFVCEICSIGFKERYHLKKHVLFKHTSELKEKCRYCDKCFKDSTAVRAHERTHSDQRPYPCPRCEKTFKTSECLWHHVNRSKTCGKSLGDMPPPCLPAARVTQRPGIARGRQQVQGLPGCEEECFVPAVAHEQVVPLVESVRLPEEEEEEEVVERRVVYHRFTPEATTLSQLNTWNIPVGPGAAEAVPAVGQEQRGDDGRATVEEDGPVLAVKVEMEMNIFDYDLTGINSPETSSLEDYCEEFERETEEDDDDDDEQEQLAGTGSSGSVFPGSTSAQTPAASPQGLAVATPSCFVQTLGTKRGVGGGRLDCGTCGKQCSTQSAFDKHSIVHSESRPYRCGECNVGFKLKVHLKKHNLYRHSDEYPCECSICGKRFKDSSAVRLHERIHSADRPFKCHCGKGFKTRENLWGHRHRGPCDDKTGSFLLQNLRVFDSDIGPIWGVPLAADQAPNPPVESNQTTACNRRRENEAVVAGGYDFLVHGAATHLSLNRTPPFVKTLVKKEDDVSDHVTSSSSSLVARPSPHVFWSQSQSSLFANPSFSSSLSLSGAHPPTAVVVPIKRETNEASTATTTMTTTSLSSSSSSSSSSSGEKCSLPPFETLVTTHRPNLSSSSSSSSSSSAGVTVMGVMGVIGDRCQKVLLTGTDPSLQTTKLPGIQQLFHANQSPMDQYRLQEVLTGSTHQVLHDRGGGGGGGGELSLLPPLLPVPPPPPYLHPSPSCPADVIVTGEMSAPGGQTSNSAAFWGDKGRGGGGGGGEEKLVSPPGVDGKNCYALQWMTSPAAQTASIPSKQTRDGQFPIGRY